MVKIQGQTMVPSSMYFKQDYPTLMDLILQMYSFRHTAKFNCNFVLSHCNGVHNITQLLAAS